MPTFNRSITDWVPGSDYDFTRTITDVPTSRTIAQAWFTVKVSAELDADADALIQKVLSTSYVADVGQITDTGSTDQIGAILVENTPAETDLLQRGKGYEYDIKYEDSAGVTHTVETGTIYPQKRVTRAT